MKPIKRRIEDLEEGVNSYEIRKRSYVKFFRNLQLIYGDPDELFNEEDYIDMNEEEFKGIWNEAIDKAYCNVLL